jgi:AbrB family looped-hinge helix DNA binding protein
MVRIQAFKGSNKLAKGKKGKEYWKHFVIIPKVLIDALGWKKGDEMEFRLEDGKVVLRKKG